MSVQSRSLFSERILHIELVYEPIFSTLSPANLVRISSTCRTAYAAVAAYTRLTFDIDRLLSRYFPSPTRGCSITCCLSHAHEQEYGRARAFRSLQARTGTLVSGSTALQFFKRTVWPESDLDLYVHMRHRREVAQWLLDEGYQYKPTDFRIQNSRNPNGIYSMPGVMAIVTFIKPLPRPDRTSNSVDGEEEADDDGPSELKVQVIVAKNTPMEVILGFHSTCVMNVISYEKAYCLFPQATLEQRRTLLSSSCRGKGKHRMDGLAKYQLRGFQVLYDLPHHEVLPDPATPLLPSFRRDRISRAESYLYPSQPSAFDLTRAATSSVQTRTKPAFRLGWRWIDDSSSWVIPLPLAGVTPPPAANPATPALTHDPVSVCNWEVRYHPGRGLVMHFEVATGKILRYRYLVTDEQLLAHLAKSSVRGYDEELPALCRDFLHGLATRRLSSLRI
ncbi:hypothetical protein C8T65DRAFT_698990 [Cerioporus squamosus]|nr:hypothetical protein C8T65DRAFT_698990 [Cerioporus squamosus]